MARGTYMAAHIVYEYTKGERDRMLRHVFNTNLMHHRDRYSADLAKKKPPNLKKRVSGGGSTNGTMLADKAKRMLRALEDSGAIIRTDLNIIVVDHSKIKELAKNVDCECSTLEREVDND